MKAPFPWFGGKRRVAPEVWAALGDVDNYVEPFGGSLAVLLERPATHTRRAETVNDADGYIANFWRAVAADPETVAHYCDWPVNETDLFARHLWLVNTGKSILLAGLENDPEFYDAKIAGWWCWGICSWIGSGWCTGTGPHTLGDAGRGVNRQLPHLGDAGRGVNRNNSGNLYGYMRQLADRLRNVRICAGDWTRVVTTGALDYGTTVGIFLDPPYLGDVRTADLYTVDDHTIAHAVREWALNDGDNPRYRIVLAGYADEHDHLIPDTWRRHSWSAAGGYATATSAGSTNRHGETLWMSPHCHNPQPTLFAP